MARRKNDDPNSLSDKEKVFTEAYASGKSHLDAAELAGFKRTEAAKVMKRAGVMRKIIELQRPYAVTWKRLQVAAQHVLFDNLTGGNEYAAELLAKLEAMGSLTPLEVGAFLEMLRVKPSDKNTAARLVLETLGKINPKSLNDAAGAEDEKMSRDEAIQLILGSDAEGEPASSDAPAISNPDDNEILH